MKKNVRRRKPVIEVLYTKCPFCESKKEPDYKNYDNLKNFITDRAKMMPSTRSGVCSKHQRELKVAIKRARHLALLPVFEQI